MNVEVAREQIGEGEQEGTASVEVERGGRKRGATVGGEGEKKGEGAI